MCYIQEQQFAAQQKESEEKTLRQLKEELQQKTFLIESQLVEHKQKVRNGKAEDFSCAW